MAKTVSLSNKRANIGIKDISASSHGGEDDPFALSSETDRNVSSIVNEEPPTSESLLDPANLSIGGSEVGLNRLDNDGDDAMKVSVVTTTIQLDQTITRSVLGDRRYFTS